MVVVSLPLAITTPGLDMRDRLAVMLPSSVEVGQAHTGYVRVYQVLSRSGDHVLKRLEQPRLKASPVVVLILTMNRSLSGKSPLM